MPLEMKPELALALSDLRQDTLIELWEVDLRGIKNAAGNVGSLYRFHNGLNGVRQNIIWQGNEYQAIAMQVTGFARKSKGQSTRPSLSIANFAGLVTGIARDFDGAAGAKVTRVQVYAKYLDAVNFKDGNKFADPTAAFPPEYFIVEQLAKLSHDVATFTLATPAETDGAMIPVRMITADTCYFQYRGYGCGYTGKPVCDDQGNPTTDPAKDGCPHNEHGCKLHFGAKAVLPYGGFPSVSKV
ncbi:lambda-like phage minor tail protein L [Pasteurella testudinis DSM 23072]|uniref:Lambda-like phage minor tail protein L n=1 Tax=Pasteurella testudinis DSM 23072 TaxID=1122938 RepID=A0A1W1V1T0_9PAST|nr:phage minor tail protein L [Pasteurella testudinis]SMB87339.1 lambda-like phage minor tail protein L [Pasteurella testudinis DSM 23072]SUB51643.1 Phage-related minor tail protein L [Pasteurella testudinis]